MITITYSPKTLEAIKAMQDLKDVCEAKRRAGEPYAEKDGALDAVKKAATAATASIVEDALYYLKNLEKPVMFNTYMEDWAVSGFVVRDAKEGIVIENKPERIAFSSLDKACGLTRAIPVPETGDAPNYKNMISIFIDNCAHNWCNSDGEASVAALPANLLHFRVTMGDNWIDSKGKPRTGKDWLVKQFNEIVSAIAPADFAAQYKMKGADVRDLITAALKYKRAAENGKAFFKLPAYSEQEELIFDRIHARMNGIETAIQDSYKHEDDESKPGNGDKPAKATGAPKAAAKETK